MLLRGNSYNMLQATPPLSELELRLLKMIDYPVDSMPDKLEIVNKQYIYFMIIVNTI